MVDLKHVTSSTYVNHLIAVAYHTPVVASLRVGGAISHPAYWFFVQERVMSVKSFKVLFTGDWSSCKAWLLSSDLQGLRIRRHGDAHAVVTYRR